VRAPKIASTGMVLALAATVLVSGVVVAWGHGGGPKREVIHTCVDDATGAIQIVRGRDTCDAGWSPLDWNGKGPKGPQGPPGEPGEPGLKKVEVVSASTMGLLGRSPVQTTLGIGVDCPGDAIATGGGGRTGGPMARPAGERRATARCVLSAREGQPRQRGRARRRSDGVVRGGVGARVQRALGLRAGAGRDGLRRVRGRRSGTAG
jgi:hypothetical protein